MSHYINEEYKIFAYRKLIDLLQKRFIRFYDNQFIDKQIFSEMGLYEKKPIFILFGILDFLEDDVENGFISLELETEDKKVKLKDGIEYLTDFYIRKLDQDRDLPYPAHLDRTANIIKDFPDIVKTSKTTDIEFIKAFLLLLLEIYALELKESEIAINNANIHLSIKEGVKFSEILTHGSFIGNLKRLTHPFDRSNFGIYGNNLLSFNKQLGITREIIKSKLDDFNINDVLIKPQIAPMLRKPEDNSTEHIFDSRLRLLDCLFYLECKQEIKIIELLPSRIVIDATNCKFDNILTDEKSLNKLLKIVPKDSIIAVVVKETDEVLYEFNNKENMRLKLFTAIAEKFPDYATRDEIINKAKIKKLSSAKSGEFYKSNVYVPIQTLGKVLNEKTKGKLSIYTSEASKKGYLLEINI